MNMSPPACIDQAAITLKANIYFDGKVVSHTIRKHDGSRVTIGIIYPGTYSFTTGSPERMDITAGSCRARVAGTADWTAYAAGSFFQVPGNSSFEIAVQDGITEYLCSFE
jgi:uncharacterized protein YaiE (UPF0345 family)